jgi:hypothetical protein
MACRVVAVNRTREALRARERRRYELHILRPGRGMYCGKFSRILQYIFHPKYSTQSEQTGYSFGLES